MMKALNEKINNLYQSQNKNMGGKGLLCIRNQRDRSTANCCRIESHGRHHRCRGSADKNKCTPPYNNPLSEMFEFIALFANTPVKIEPKIPEIP